MKYEAYFFLLSFSPNIWTFQSVICCLAEIHTFFSHLNEHVIEFAQSSLFFEHFPPLHASLFSEDYENKDNEDNETYEDFYILMQIMSDYPQ